MKAPDKRTVEPPKKQRRSFTKAFKAELVSIANSGRISVSQLAIDYKLNTNQLRKWIKEDIENSTAPALVPVHTVSVPQSVGAEHSYMELVSGSVTLRFFPGCDTMVIATLVRALQ